MTSEKLFVCQFCPSSFATRDSHYLHQCDVHMALMCCSFCSFHLDPNRLDIDQIDQMRNHLIYSHLRQKSWYCVRCWQEFSQKTDLLAHLTRAHSVRFGSYSIADTKCDLCGMILPSITSYQHHHQVSHTCLDARCGLIESLKRLNEEFAVQPEVQKSKKVELKSEPITNLVKRMSYASKGYWAPMRSEKKPTKAALIPREKTRQVAKLMCLHCQNRFVESDLLGHLRGVWLKDKNALVYCEECCQPARDMKEFRTHLTCLHREQLRVEHKCQKCRYACASAEALQVHFENFHRAKECPNCHLYLVNLISYSYGHQKICKEHSNGTPVDISQRVQSLVDSLKVTVRNDTVSRWY